MDKSLPIREFPLEEFKAEQEREHAEFATFIQESSTKFIDQNPKLRDLEIEAMNDIKLSLVLGYSPPKGVLLKYLQEEQSYIEDQIGRPVKPDEVDGLITLSPSESTRLNLMLDNTKILEEMKRQFLMWIDKNISEAQTIRPDIQIVIYLPDCRGAQLLVYIESKGTVLEDKIVKLPTATLDTNVVRVWLEKEKVKQLKGHKRKDQRKKVKQVKRLLDLNEKLEINLAVTGRICDDIPDPPLAKKINELPNLNILDIGSVIRSGHWKVGDVAGNDKFKKFLNSPAVVKKLNEMNKKKKPDWRDWDHLHTHYIWKRDYFLTWDKGILHFADELKKELGIIVLKPDTF